MFFFLIYNDLANLLQNVDFFYSLPIILKSSSDVLPSSYNLKVIYCLHVLFQLHV